MLIHVKTFPRAKKEEIVEKKPGHFYIYVREAPERGEATRAVVNALANHFGLPSSKIRLVKGARVRSKIFSLPDIH